MTTVHLKWEGPFAFTSAGGERILASPMAEQSGIYVWVARTANGQLLHYVGETGKSFASKGVTHLFLAEVAKSYLTYTLMI